MHRIQTPHELTSALLRARRECAARPALRVGGASWSYAELFAMADKLGGSLKHADLGAHRVAGVLAYRSVSAYAAVLGAHGIGAGYVPLHPRYPISRLRHVLDASGTKTIVVGAEGLACLQALLAELPAGFTILAPELSGFDGIESRYPHHRYIAGNNLRESAVAGSSAPDADATAYLLFTSGSTGVPKGVPVSFANLAAYIGHIEQAYRLGPEDRVSQAFDMTFDLSVHDMFTAWTSGACLCVVPEESLLAPAKFIRDEKLTVWFSVPSVAMNLARLRVLKPGVFPDLRLSFFCGEALPVMTAVAWSAAAPGSRVINLYGPTETTIAVTEYEWREASLGEAKYDLVPIGKVFPGHEVALLDETGRVQRSAGRGELCLSGPQVTRGYLNRPDKTAHHFIRLQGEGDALWYRTGDIVERREDGCLFFVGRADTQIKLNGYRIELQEVDAALRRITGSDFAVAVPWPVEGGTVRGIVGCVAAAGELSAPEILARCRVELPAYMVPAFVVLFPSLPCNSNGKIDRKALYDHLQAHPPKETR